MIQWIQNKIKFIYSYFSFIGTSGFKQFDLIIYDTIYPHPSSGFRLEEITTLLKHFKKSKILLNPTAYAILKTPLTEHKRHIKNLLNSEVGLEKKLLIKKGIFNFNSKLFYTIFLSNMVACMPIIEKFKIPFIFTLYPGGGFRVNDIESDNQLKTILNSKYFRKVIVTQNFTYEYLTLNNFCPPENILFVFGGIVPQTSLVDPISNKKFYNFDKQEFNICFCASKYTQKGEDKGYDIFIDFAHQLYNKFNFVYFHIIGGFGQEDIDVSKIMDRTKFYGYLNFEDLSKEYKNMEVIVSPNQPFKLASGAFDGFPLGTLVEAVLNKVVVLTTDELKQNKYFEDGKEIIILENNAEDILKKTEELINNPELLKNIAEAGKKKFSTVFSNKNQLEPRIKLLESYINKA